MGERAVCRYCGYSIRLRVDGQPQNHHVYAGGKKWLCPGSSDFTRNEDVAVWLARREARDESVIHAEDCQVHQCMPPWRCTCGALARREARDG